MGRFRTIGAIVLLLFLLGKTRAQSYQAPKKSDPLEMPELNTVYMELLGSAGAYSLNYERTFVLGPPLSLRGRIGASFFGGSFILPAYIQMSHAFPGPFEMEWGGGLNLLPRFGKNELAHEWGALVGFRLRNELGLFFRMAYTPRFPVQEGEGVAVCTGGGLSMGFFF